MEPGSGCQLDELIRFAVNNKFTNTAIILTGIFVSRRNKMKKSLVICLLMLFFSIAVLAQYKPIEKDQSNIEKFSSKSGTLIEKRFVDIGKINGVTFKSFVVVEIQVLFLTDMINTGKAVGVRFEFQMDSSNSGDTQIAFLDQDEVDGLIKSINIIKTKVFLTKPVDYTEVIFTSRSGFSLACYKDNANWGLSMKAEKYDRDSNVLLKTEALDTLLDLLQKARQKIITG